MVSMGQNWRKALWLLLVLSFQGSALGSEFFDRPAGLAAVNFTVPHRRKAANKAHSAKHATEKSKFVKPAVATKPLASLKSVATAQPQIKTQPAPTATEIETSEWWEVTHPMLDGFAAMRESPHHRLVIRRFEFPLNEAHSCYQYRLIDTTNQTLIKTNKFCYPAIIITGVPKCSTTGMFHLLLGFKNIRKLHDKEICPYQNFKGSLTDFFDRLAYVPNNKRLTSEHAILSGCIVIEHNMMMHEILRRPKSLYIVVVRDYADWLWAGYNYWCHRVREANCENGWAKPGVHTRTPEHFHTLIMRNLHSTTSYGADYSMGVIFEQNACLYARTGFQRYVKMLNDKVGPGQTLVIASEALSHDADIVVKLVSEKMGWKAGVKNYVGNLTEFKSIRYNTNDVRGMHAKKASAYRPGVYAISGNRPMLPETRALLLQCWEPDCMFISQASNHSYECNAWRSVIPGVTGFGQVRKAAYAVVDQMEAVVQGAEMNDVEKGTELRVERV